MATIVAINGIQIPFNHRQTRVNHHPSGPIAPPQTIQSGCALWQLGIVAKREAQAEPEQVERLLTALTKKIDQLLAAANAKRGPELWSQADIGAWLGIKVRTVYDVVARPEFPTPVTATESRQGAKRWLAEEVIEWAQSNQRTNARRRR